MANRYGKQKQRQQRRDVALSSELDEAHYEPRRPESSEQVFRFPAPGDPDLEVKMHKWTEDGKLTDFLLQVHDTRNDTLLTSVDCKHGTIHRHNEAYSGRPRKELFPLFKQEQLGEFIDLAVDEVVKFAKDVKTQRRRK